MAKYLAQIIVMGVQVVGRAFARALRQEFAASRAAADARGRAGHQSAAASSLSGLSLQEAQQILNISKLSPEEIQKAEAETGAVGDSQTHSPPHHRVWGGGWGPSASPCRRPSALPAVLVVRRLHTSHPPPFLCRTLSIYLR
ncbi:mitochondrial import inner membrane translocase subunit TIM16 isoform X1 [Choloepus didactylus]|uniref:mitochondrial import inner membrane translocase subunit TIM16 isoform X1 n=1 Tax=Choloepus didactylus TaxID=27675 RepID=UPI00189F476F|nr:mitochondrial import inner membrane translocase subunit TIM16 isoform X1 [Choloepus didactylus]XP_037670995.1 mitochondrial import inner membrane translocase subunit TIM16 isoform X1 [Choloepus didactylus]